MALVRLGGGARAAEAGCWRRAPPPPRARAAIPKVLATSRGGALDGWSPPPGVGVLREPLSRSAMAVALRRALAAAEEPVGA